MALPIKFVQTVTDALEKKGVTREMLAEELEPLDENQIDLRLNAFAKELGISPAPPVSTGAIQQSLESTIPRALRGRRPSPEPPQELRSFTENFITGATFGAGSLLEEQRQRATKEAEESPGFGALGLIAGSLSPFSTIRAITRIPQGIKAIGNVIKAAKNARRLKDISASIPGLGSQIMTELFNVSKAKPGLVSETLGAMALTKVETGSTTQSLVAGALSGSLGALFKIGGGIGGKTAKSSFASPEVQELTRLYRTDRQRYNQIISAVSEGDARLLDDIIKPAQDFIKDKQLEFGFEKNRIVRGIQKWFSNARKHINQNFGKATLKFLEKNEGASIEVTDLVKFVDEKIDSLKDQGLLEQNPFIVQFKQSLGDVKPGQPRTRFLSEILGLRQLAKGESDFTRIAHSENAVARELFDKIRNTIKTQAPEYAQILDNYAVTINPFNRVSTKFRPSRTAPGKIIDKIYSNPTEESDFLDALQDFQENAKTGNTKLDTALKFGLEQVRLSAQEGALFRQLSAQFPKDPKMLRVLLLKSSLEELDNPMFRDFMRTNKTMKKAYDEVRAFRHAESLLGGIEGFLDEATTLIARPKVGVSGITRGGLLKKLAAENPAASSKLLSLQESWRSLSKPSKKIILTVFKGLLPTTEDLTQILPVILESETKRVQFRQRMKIFESYSDTIEKEGEQGAEELRQSFNLSPSPVKAAR